MSVIAWDGSIIAADKMACCGYNAVTTTKLHMMVSGLIIGWTGDATIGAELMSWYQHGANVEDWPKVQATDDWCRLIVWDPKHSRPLRFYESRPFSFIVQDRFAAWGSGRDYAIGAMAQGANAIDAVKIASQHCISCGMGIDHYPAPAETNREDRFKAFVSARSKISEVM